MATLTTVFPFSARAGLVAADDTHEGKAGDDTRSVASPPSPSLSESNNSDKEDEGKVNKLTGGHRRMAYVLTSEIQWLAKCYGIERIGFLTLTFADHVTKIKEAQRRFNNLNRRILKARYSNAIGVVERQESGRLHFHLLVVLNADIRTGFDFKAIERRDYRSANSELRAEWAFWRRTAPKYRFGRTELLPVKSNADGIARYVGKYVSKHIGKRVKDDKGARVVRFIGYKPGTRHAFSSFAWNTANGWLWRHKLAAWAKRHDVATVDELRNIFGRRWAYLLQDEILGERVDEVFPNHTSAERSFNLECKKLVKFYQADHEIEKRASACSRVYQLKDDKTVRKSGVRVIEWNQQTVITKRHGNSA